jgi:hypothetical protein
MEIGGSSQTERSNGEIDEIVSNQIARQKYVSRIFGFQNGVRWKSLHFTRDRSAGVLRQHTFKGRVNHQEWQESSSAETIT